MDKFKKKYRLLLVVLVLVIVFFNVIGRVSLNREPRTAYPDQPLLQLNLPGVEWLSFSVGGTLRNLILTALLLWLIGCLWDRELRPSACGWEIPVLVFLAAVTISYLLAREPELSWRTGYRNFLIEIGWFFLLLSLLRREKYRRAVMAVLTGSLALTVLGGLNLYRQGVFFPQTPGRIWLSFGHPNSSGSVLVLLLPLVLAPLLFRPPRRVVILSAVLAAGLLAGLFLTLSRTAWVSLLPGLVVLFWRGKTKYFLPGALVAAAGLLLLGLNLSRQPFWQERVESFSSWRTDENVQKRMIYWDAAVRMIRERPWFGFGPGYGVFIRQYDEEFGVIDTGEEVTAPHNNYLSLAVASGLIGLGTFLLLVFAVFRAARRELKDCSGWAARSFSLGLISGLTGFLVGCLFDDPLLNEKISLLFWLLLGILAAGTARRRAGNLFPACETGGSPVASRLANSYEKP